MDIRKVRKLIELIEETGVAEIEIKEGEDSVRICRTSSHAGAMPQTFVLPSNVQPPAPPSTSTTTTETSTKETIPQGHKVTSPMVGTLYRAPSPGANSFVEIGQQVKIGDTLCIIEAIKMFNEIESDKAGTIKAILVESGEPVEFGQDLFVIE